MNLTIADAQTFKRETEQAIAKLLQDFQERTGMTVTGIEHYITESYTMGVPKIVRANIHVELK